MTSDYARREWSRARRRMLDGRWGDDLVNAMARRLGVPRTENMGQPSLAVNLALQVCEQVGPVLYDSAPTVTEAGDLPELLTRIGLWVQAQRLGLYAYGLRECAYRVDWSETAQEPRVYVVTPDALDIETDPDDPTRLLVVRHWRMRIDPDTGKPAEFCDVYDLPNETFRIEDAAGVVRSDMLPEQQATFWRDGEGAYLPWSLYHAEPTGHVFSPYGLTELFEASLDCGILWNGFQHIMLNASWAQRYGLNVELADTPLVRNGSAQITVAPNSFARFRGTDGQAGELGTLAVPVDPESYGRAVLSYQRTATAGVGLHPTDIEQTSAESGYAISLKRSAQRRMAEKLEPQFRRGDLETMSIIARVSNQYGGTAYPTSGYQIVYAPPADSVSERDEAFEYNRKLNEARLISRVDWYLMTFPGVTRDQAEERIVGTAVEEAMLARLTQQATQAITPTEETP